MSLLIHTFRGISLTCLFRYLALFHHTPSLHCGVAPSLETLMKLLPGVRKSIHTCHGSFGLPFDFCSLSFSWSLGCGSSSKASPACSFFSFSRSRFKAFSSILMCFPSESCRCFDVLLSPSSLPIRDFISARSISQAFRSRSCRCHSLWRNRMTPVDASLLAKRADDQPH